MVKSTTGVPFNLEIEDENEKVDNSYINRNFEKINTEGRYTPHLGVVNWISSYNIGFVIKQYADDARRSNFVISRDYVYNYFKGKFDLLYDKTSNYITGAASTILTNLLTANNVVTTNAEGRITNSNVSTAELETLKNVSSNIQVQLNDKAPKSHSSTGTSYGVSSTTSYGHTKMITNLTNNGRNNSTSYNGECLAASQGYKLDQNKLDKTVYNNDQSALINRVITLENASIIRTGTAVPSNSLGKNGDVYIQI